jgi:hypothetical protein
LPVSKPVEAPKDVVTDFLERATSQEKQEREEEAKKNKDPVVEAAHKQISLAEEPIESNPLMELYMKQHPKLLEQAKETDWSSVAKGEDSA